MASLEDKQPIDLPLNSLHLRFYIAYETLQMKPFDATNDFLSGYKSNTFDTAGDKL